MKQTFVLLAVLALSVVVLNACEKKQTAGQQLDAAVAGVEQAATDAHKAVTE